MVKSWFRSDSDVDVSISLSVPEMSEPCHQYIFKRVMITTSICAFKGDLADLSFTSRQPLNKSVFKTNEWLGVNFVC